MRVKASLKRNKIWQLYQAQDGICAHCLKPLPHPDIKIDGGIPESPSLDRIKTGMHGGTYATTNLLLVHKRCNEIRDTKPISASARAMHRKVLRWLKENNPNVFAKGRQ